ncbi:ATP-dependent helicase HrpB [Gynuella sunshinyii]|uniref:HrpA-like helicase n=1 Tax=Gynuella sunshinyii YC6258 TaxID=1445510 RepID=A0A0C5VQB0_9GAMM|nr:ATP-dependent helicase HrpB [Gynuella sunshinyii]AJQ96742.1 hrpA-like helicase [Gynuella sunshinyii YC6258]
MTLPVFDIQEPLQSTLSNHPITLLQAPPGSGKTSWVPIWLNRLGGKVLLIQPRRIAVLNAVRQLSRNLDDRPEGTVGYRMRFDTHITRHTEIEVVTEGVFVRLLQSDPELAGYQWVIFDEFHERNLDADLGLALVRSCHELFRPDLKILLMSATLNEGRISQQLGAPVIKSDGRSFPIEIRYQHAASPDMNKMILQAINSVLATVPGNLLVFLPGMKEILSCRDFLQPQLPDDLQIDILHGSCSIQEQKQALELTQQRKLILASPVAESSITLPDIRVVIDSGLARFPRYDRDTGMTHLMTRKISKANADQRAGRAGRTAPGICIRLWSEDQQNGLAPFPAVEIEQADYSRMLLEIAAWGMQVDELNWLTKPNPANVTETQSMLKSIAAVHFESGLHITDHGQKLLSMPCHPRLAHMICEQPGDLTVRLAVLLQERPVPQGMVDDSWLKQTLTTSERQLQQRLSKLVTMGHYPDWKAALCQAFPDHIGHRLSDNKIKLANGQQLTITKPDSYAPWLLALKFNDQRIISWIDLKDFQPQAFPNMLIKQNNLTLENNRLQAKEVELFGRIRLKQRNIPVNVEQRLQFWDDYFHHHGLSDVPLTDAEKILLKRMSWMSELTHDEQWPGKSRSPLDFLCEHRQQYLLPICTEVNCLNDIEISRALDMMLSWEQRQALDNMLPVSIVINDRPRPLVYGEQGRVSIAIKLQETFGLLKNPTIAGGRIPVVFELLSPAGRPLQITADLEHFWHHNYQDIRKEMRGRYPKHPWPEDPVNAKPTAYTKRHAARSEL